MYLDKVVHLQTHATFTIIVMKCTRSYIGIRIPVYLPYSTAARIASVENVITGNVSYPPTVYIIYGYIKLMEYTNLWCRPNTCSAHKRIKNQDECLTMDTLQ